MIMSLVIMVYKNMSVTTLVKLRDETRLHVCLHHMMAKFYPGKIEYCSEQELNEDVAWHHNSALLKG